MSRKTIKIYSKVRFYTFLTIVIILLVNIATLVFVKADTTEKTSWLTVYIEQGDTIWSIAKQTVPKHKDIRDYIYEIKEANKLVDYNIKYGETLIIPIY